MVPVVVQMVADCKKIYNVQAINEFGQSNDCPYKFHYFVHHYIIVEWNLCPGPIVLNLKQPFYNELLSSLSLHVPGVYLPLMKVTFRVFFIVITCEWPSTALWYITVQLTE